MTTSRAALVGRDAALRQMAAALETDAQAVVFYANYIAYFDIVMTEFWRDAVPGGYTDMVENGTDMVVIETTALSEFTRPRRVYRFMSHSFTNQ